ncbi:MAG: GreA/GreB family elongation factor [Trueperaceae bacterium]|nr:GreA/GreB family elongation factor [Trueperaceae bacterium]
MALRVRITPEGYERLKATLEQEYARLAEATTILQELTGSSDDYDDSGLEEAKAEKARIERRIDELELQLNRADVIEGTGRGIVDLGSVVTLYDVKAKDEFKVQVVSPIEAGVLEGDIPKVSDASPLGKALMGRNKGEKFKVTTQGGVTEYELRDIG